MKSKKDNSARTLEILDYLREDLPEDEKDKEDSDKKPKKKKKKKQEPEDYSVEEPVPTAMPKRKPAPSEWLS